MDTLNYNTFKEIGFKAYRLLFSPLYGFSRAKTQIEKRINLSVIMEDGELKSLNMVTFVVVKAYSA